MKETMIFQHFIWPLCLAVIHLAVGKIARSVMVYVFHIVPIFLQKLQLIGNDFIWSVTSKAQAIFHTELATTTLISSHLWLFRCLQTLLQSTLTVTTLFWVSKHPAFCLWKSISNVLQPQGLTNDHLGTWNDFFN